LIDSVEGKRLKSYVNQYRIFKSEKPDNGSQIHCKKRGGIKGTEVENKAPNLIACGIAERRKRSYGYLTKDRVAATVYEIEKIELRPLQDFLAKYQKK